MGALEAQRWYERPLNIDIETIELTSLGRTIRVGIAEPPACRNNTHCPIALVLPGGLQNQNLMEETLRPWAQMLREAGWVVLSPIAPSREDLFYGDGAPIVIHMLSHMKQRLGLDTRRITLVGISNGGISAYRVATLAPDYFHRVVVAPGYADDVAIEHLDRLRGLDLISMVGANDPWIEPATQTHQVLHRAGIKSSLIVVSQGHHTFFATLPWDTIDELLNPERMLTCHTGWTCKTLP